MADRVVTASAPGKLMILGEHAVVYGHPCIVTAVNQRVRVSVAGNGEGEIHVSSPSVGLDEYHKSLSRLGEDDVPKSVAFVEMAVKRFYQTYALSEGVRITTESDFSSTFGFGSSAAVVVALLAALGTYFDREMSQRELFEMAFGVVLDVQGVGSGFDVAASVYGGTLYFVTGGKVIESIWQGELPLVVGYTGIKADTPTLIRQVAELKRGEKWVDSVLSEMGELVKEGREALRLEDWEKLGAVMDANQTLLEALKVSSKELDAMILAARNAGALGAKLSGAGGGDCMLALVPSTRVLKSKVQSLKLATTNHDSIINNQKSISEAIGQTGEVMGVKTGAEGVRIEDRL